MTLPKRGNAPAPAKVAPVPAKTAPGAGEGYVVHINIGLPLSHSEDNMYIDLSGEYKESSGIQEE